MKHSYKVTIALLTYNRCAKGFLKQSLEAALGQTLHDFELLVVDNHSSDRTAELVMGYEDPRLTYIRQPPGGNATASYIRSAHMSRGEYILFAHDDDVMEPNMIEGQLGFIERHPDLLVASNNVSLIDESGRPIQAKLYDLEEDRSLTPPNTSKGTWKKNYGCRPDTPLQEGTVCQGRIPMAGNAGPGISRQRRYLDPVHA